MAVHLVRHADAGSHRRHDDEGRPISDRGRKQAKAVRDALRDAPVGRIVSSRYTRCLETVRPLADRLHVAVEVHPALAEEADVGASWELLEQLAETGGDTVVCSHGNVLSALLDRVHRRGVEVVADEWSCRKGSVWRLETDPSGRFLRAVLVLRPG
ncbi:MAG: histidine phosphatase family protein [Acidimicrobiia bacterium]